MAKRASPVASQMRFLGIGGQMDRKVRHQHDTEIADGQQQQRSRGEPAREFTLRFRQQHHDGRDGDDAGSQGEPANGGAGIERDQHAQHNPAAEKYETLAEQRCQGRQVVAHRKCNHQHGQHAECQIGRSLVAGRKVLESFVLKVGEWSQRHPGHQQRANEDRSPQQIHHLLTAQCVKGGADLRMGRGLAHEAIFEAL